MNKAEINLTHIPLLNDTSAFLFSCLFAGIQIIIHILNFLNCQMAALYCIYISNLTYGAKVAPIASPNLVHSACGTTL